ncbi:MAG: hypothetical protein A2Y97_09860 [Nitrospirae bacterium RBG_13_39_12]|nr:MAG: hypothetical protein A2Y97_09860 [Nitrospirae bacterium RBG_13_39_12]
MTYKKRWVNIFFCIFGISIALLYSICRDSCEYLHGSILGLNLNHLGIFYMLILSLFSLIKWESIFLLLVSFGTGAELQLLHFQVNNSIYCAYCLLFAAVIIVLFLLNFEKSKKTFIAISLVLGFILFSIFLKGSATPVYAEEPPFSSFGDGKITVRLYTDYFCKPCKELEPKLEPVITELVKKNIINISFIDTPVHPQTTLYANYFLYILNKDKKFNRAIRARSILFEAADGKITDIEKLEIFIKNKGMNFKPFNTKRIFDNFSNYLKEDTINATPTCIISNEGKKDKFTGSDILKALEHLK